MCYSMHCKYQDYMGDCTIHNGTYPNDATCQEELAMELAKCDHCDTCELAKTCGEHPAWGCPDCVPPQTNDSEDGYDECITTDSVDVCGSQIVWLDEIGQFSANLVELDKKNRHDKT